ICSRLVHPYTASAHPKLHPKPSISCCLLSGWILITDSVLGSGERPSSSSDMTIGSGIYTSSWLRLLSSQAVMQPSSKNKDVLTNKYIFFINSFLKLFLIISITHSVPLMCCSALLQESGNIYIFP